MPITTINVFWEYLHGGTAELDGLLAGYPGFTELVGMKIWESKEILPPPFLSEPRRKFMTPQQRILFRGLYTEVPDYVSFTPSISFLRAVQAERDETMGLDNLGATFRWGRDVVLGTASFDPVIWESTGYYPDMIRLYILDETSTHNGWMAEVKFPPQNSEILFADWKGGNGQAKFEIVVGLETLYNANVVDSYPPARYDGDITVQVEVDGDITSYKYPVKAQAFTPPVYPVSASLVAGDTFRYYGTTDEPFSRRQRFTVQDEPSRIKTGIVELAPDIRAAPRIRKRVFTQDGHVSRWMPYYVPPVPKWDLIPMDEEFFEEPTGTDVGAYLVDFSPSYHPEGEVIGFRWTVADSLLGIDKDTLIWPDGGPIGPIVVGRNTKGYIQSSNGGPDLQPQYGTQGAVAVHPAGFTVLASYVGNHGIHDEPNNIPAIGLSVRRSNQLHADFREFDALRARSPSIWFEGGDLMLFARRYDNERWQLWRYTDYEGSKEEVSEPWDENYKLGSAAQLVPNVIMTLALRRPTEFTPGGDLYSRISFDGGEHWSEPRLVRAGTGGRWSICDSSSAGGSTILITNGGTPLRSTDYGETWT